MWLIETKSLDESITTNKKDSFVKEKINEGVYSVSKNIDDFHFNKSIANLYTLINMMQKSINDKNTSKKILLSGFKTIALLLQPFTPHLSEEMWKELGEKDLAINQKWPEIVGNVEKSISKIAIQINGKTREIIEFNNGSSQKTVEDVALKSNKIQKQIMEKEIKKIIFVPERVLNIVI